MADRMGRMLSAAAFGGIAFAAYLLQAKDVARMITQGSLSLALTLGRIIREAREKGRDPVAAAAECVGGWVLFRGTVTKTEWEDKEAYMFGYGTHHLEGLDDYAGQTFRIWYKNEYHISWRNDQPFVTSPDTLAVVDLETGEPHTNYSLAAGQRIAIVGRKSALVYRTERGLALLGPKHFGFDIEYVPIEQQVG